MNLAIGAHTIRLTVADTSQETASDTATLNISGEFTFRSTPDGSADRFTMRVNGDQLEIRDTDSDTLLHSAPASGVTSVVIIGSTDDDALTVDLSGGDPIPAGGAEYHGGVGGDDSLAIVQGSVDNVTHRFENTSDGQVEIDGRVIRYTGLEPIFDHLQAVDRFFTFLGADNDITLGDDGTAGNNMSRVSSASSSETVDFLNPTASLTVNTRQGDDVARLNALDAGPDGDPLPFEVEINGQGGDNVIDASQFPDPLAIVGTDGDDVLTVANTDFRRIDGAGGYDTVQLSGARLDLDLTAVDDNAFTGIEQIDITGSGANGLTLDAQEVRNASDTGDVLAVLAGGDDAVDPGDGWTLTETTIIDGTFYRVLQQGGAKLLLNGPHNWQNPIDRFDVDASGQVSSRAKITCSLPGAKARHFQNAGLLLGQLILSRALTALDVLILINEVNGRQYSDANGRLPDAAATTPFPLRFFDPDGNGSIAPIDVLSVINRINADVQQPPAEGEAAAATISILSLPSPATPLVQPPARAPVDRPSASVRRDDPIRPEPAQADTDYRSGVSTPRPNVLAKAQHASDDDSQPYSKIVDQVLAGDWSFEWWLD